MTCIELLIPDSAKARLSALYDGCACPGNVVVYECTVQGGLSTVWRGSAFDCNDNNNIIILHHVWFGTETAVGECNNNNIVGRGLRTENSSFTSRLYVTICPQFNNKTIECTIHEGSTLTSIGSYTLNVTTGIIIVCNTA